MKIKTSELTGAALDWAVAKCDDPEMATHMGLCGTIFDGYHYSTEWSQGGPIIEALGIHLRRWEVPISTFKVGFEWRAEVRGTCYSGPTPLIAAMRCYVASKLGNEVDVPEELV